MKTLLLSLALLLVTGRTFAQAPPATTTAADETAIRQLVQRMAANWTNHHFADMETYTTPDVSWVNIVGMWWRGRPAVQQAHQQIFDTMFKGVPFTLNDVNVRFVTPDVAVVNAHEHVGAFYPPDGINRGANKAGDTDELMTLVMVKQQGRWLLTAGQNTVIDARAAASNPMQKPAK
ncbi:SgcJ/EcaC family oxidoreductase [Hymenobacter sp. ASUV-10]|uniref:SgcJ/EcaC family oxidoreductase n=1 Tax=Hymenobacter aranciens TaxID=3063996 RepID=A0ABT9BMG3_9BACT|nr:SgcJ/EcaC family oxidoreductase [Hymenobacter sp. ASUV-10]MDO7877708.1 SgcJ/EcaC family oxidoreductase [Hymenobacter sp. ASUV-10]